MKNPSNKKIKKQKKNKFLQRKELRYNPIHHPLPLNHLPDCYNFSITPKDWLTLSAPEIFSLLKDTPSYINMINHFSDIEEKLISGNDLILDLSAIEHVSRESIVYLLSIISRAKKENYPGRIKRIYGPSDPSLDSAVRDSGLLAYVRSQCPALKNTDILSITQFDSKNKYQPGILHPVRQFSEKVLPDKGEDFWDEIDDLIVEATGNAHEHAYTSGGNWSIFGVKGDEYFKIIVMDNGIGIVKSIKKKFRDVIKSQQDLLKSALTTDNYRSSQDDATWTNKTSRGNGLISLYRAYDQEMISGLTVFSNKAIFMNDIFDNSSKNFNGTMIIFHFKLQEFKNEII